MYNFIESSYDQNREYFNRYIKNLSYNIESFQEEHILNSRVFSIFVEEKHQGYFAFAEKVFDIEGFTVLTQFMLEPQVLKDSQQIFNQILEEYEIKSAFAASGDELLLSLAMDFHKSVTMQAYIHTDGKADVRSAEFPRSCMLPVKAEELPEVLRLTNNYFDFLLEPRKKDMFQLYVLKDRDIVLGFGLLEAGEIVKDTYSLGIYTMAEHRQKGVGRSIMMHLKDICYEKGLKPITGCNWYNKKSKATLESAGFVSKTRLFKIEFTEEKKWVSI